MEPFNLRLRQSTVATAACFAVVAILLCGCSKVTRVQVRSSFSQPVYVYRDFSGTGDSAMPEPGLRILPHSTKELTILEPASSVPYRLQIRSMARKLLIDITRSRDEVDDVLVDDTWKLTVGPGGVTEAMPSFLERLASAGRYDPPALALVIGFIIWRRDARRRSDTASA
jgi:hypothetical protein